MDYASLPAREIGRLSRNVAPGAWAVERERPLSTLLGSCVAVCMFDPQARIGGINHFMLPNMQRNAHSEVDSLLSGDYAMEALLNALSLDPNLPFLILGLMVLPEEDEELGAELEETFHQAVYLQTPWMETEERANFLTLPTLILGSLTNRLEEDALEVLEESLAELES